jgi:hypothetical protein
MQKGNLDLSFLFKNKANAKDLSSQRFEGPRDFAFILQDIAESWEK